ncbi:MAG: aminotransferase [Lautropia sp.]
MNHPADLSERARKDVSYHLHPYTNLRQLERDGPLVIVRGDGVRVFDEAGNAYLEGMAGLWCASLGFSERRLADAAHRQLLELPYYHSFTGKVPGPVTELAAKLIALAPVPMGRVVFANSGSEANDTAWKLVRYYNNARGRPGKKKILARVKGYHGVTAAAASMSGLPTMHEGFDLPLPGIVRIDAPYHYQFARPGESVEAFTQRLLATLEQQIVTEGPETIAAMIAEPVQGAGGVIVPPPGYWEGVQKLLKAHDILLIADEVICGFGRLGEYFGSTVFGMKPDLITVAKALTSAYVPLSALYVSQAMYEAVADAGKALGPFAHGYTYSGHPLACAMALETLRIYEDDRILDHVRRVAPVLQQGLRRFEGHPIVGEVRGLGLIGAVELAEDPAARKPFDPKRGVGPYLVARAQAHGLILRGLAGDAIAFSPPLIITEAEIGEMLERFGRALDDTLAWVRG